MASNFSMCQGAANGGADLFQTEQLNVFLIDTKDEYKTGSARPCNKAGNILSFSNGKRNWKRSSYTISPEYGTGKKETLNQHYLTVNIKQQW